jgi:hypothetical protein
LLLCLCGKWLAVVLLVQAVLWLVQAVQLVLYVLIICDTWERKRHLGREWSALTPAAGRCGSFVHRSMHRLLA